MGLAGCAAPAPPPAEPELLTADGVERVSVDRADFAAELRSFRASAYALGEALLADGGDGANGNVVSSPGSLLIALAMVRAGATGGTAAEMDSILQFPAEKRDEAMNSVLRSLEKFDGDPGSVDEDNPPRKPVMHSANELFVDKDVPTGQSFLDTLARHYGSGVYPVDFSDEGTTKPAIDAWVNRNTGGRIKEAPAQYDPDNTFSLLNTLYFASAWSTPFDPNATSDLPFTTAAGEGINVPAMHNELRMKYAEGAGWQGVDLPYADGFVMRLVLPAETSPAADTAASTDTPALAVFGAEKLMEIADTFDAARPASVQIQLPRWDHRSSFNLRKVFEALGLENMLGTTEDFNSIQPQMMITQAAQAANITVAEKGTIAAAVTQINGMATSAPPEPERTIEFDRPFHYQIVHGETGLPLFMGTVADPR
ncbi:serpin family protein [Pseudarthrobacter phenanthrenivorans]|uniref:Serpin family protein n=1 Tax=Pseudarthrobacter phenanthrenivorans TaxID=361575 RepID=A0A3B0FY42_PSEPS|nr:serpin family protein [Pseudarthrobacter phenanthrenivorans]RKO24598.1 serpin family protein [Pseudarthrobacter phenanthrenivorans]